MLFSAFGMAGSTRVGNALGAGSAEGARLAALSAAAVAPLIWVVVAAILVTPLTQNLLLSLFTTGTDELLLQRMRSLLYLVVLLELFDGGWEKEVGGCSRALPVSASSRLCPQRVEGSIHQLVACAPSSFCLQAHKPSCPASLRA
jgi:Na+-driven multidrug efflux pump